MIMKKKTRKKKKKTLVKVSHDTYIYSWLTAILHQHNDQLKLQRAGKLMAIFENYLQTMFMFRWSHSLSISFISVYVWAQLVDWTIHWKLKLLNILSRNQMDNNIKYHPIIKAIFGFLSTDSYLNVQFFIKNHFCAMSTHQKHKNYWKPDLVIESNCVSTETTCSPSYSSFLVEPISFFRPDKSHDNTYTIHSCNYRPWITWKFNEPKCNSFEIVIWYF